MTNPIEAPERIYATDYNQLMGEPPWSLMTNCTFKSLEPDTGLVECETYLRLDIHEREMRELREALRELVERLEPCTHKDHHGYCQTHFLDEDCPVSRARALIGEE